MILKPYLAAKSWYSLAVNWLPLSEIISSGIPNTEKEELRAEITSLDEVAEWPCTTGNLEW